MANIPNYVAAIILLVWACAAFMPRMSYKRQGGLRFVTLGRLSLSYSFRKGN